MALIYLTNDVIGAPTGGGRVTKEELTALRSLGFVHTVHPRRDLHDPFEQDEDAYNQLRGSALHTDPAPRLCHVYAGCFTRSVAYLKEIGYKVTYTVAAHDVDLSRKAHEELGIPFPYPHLNDPTLFSSYIAAYRDLADVVIVPGLAPLSVVRKQRRTRRTVVIPHGCDIPETTAPVPQTFTVGYLGAPGPDKGMLTLAKAWATARSRRVELAGARLLLGGSQSHLLKPLFDAYGCRDVDYHGWYDNVSDFYSSITLYVQPSNTEGFGIEVIEAMAHCRPVLCSLGAGAADLVPAPWTFRAGDHETLAYKLGIACEAINHKLRHDGGDDHNWWMKWRERALPCAWDKIREQYVALWKEVISGQ